MAGLFWKILFQRPVKKPETWLTIPGELLGRDTGALTEGADDVLLAVLPEPDGLICFAETTSLFQEVPGGEHVIKVTVGVLV
jgi:hypothetical protein